MATPDLELSTLPNGDCLVTVPQEKQVCDFCRAPEVACAYPCVDFGFEDCNFYSRGAWAACATCRELLEAGRFSDLASLVAALEADQPEDVPALAEFLRMVYAVFSQLRLGPAQEVTP